MVLSNQWGSGLLCQLLALLPPCSMLWHNCVLYSTLTYIIPSDLQRTDDLSDLCKSTSPLEPYSYDLTIQQLIPHLSVTNVTFRSLEGWGYLCSPSMICLACTLPYMYNLVPVVFGTVIPTSLYIFLILVCVLFWYTNEGCCSCKRLSSASKEISEHHIFLLHIKCKEHSPFKKSQT